MPPRARPAAAKIPAMAKAAATFNPSADMRIVVLKGPDEWMRRHHHDRLHETLRQAHGEVEVRRFEGESAELAEVLDELRSYTLMQTYKLVVVDDADAFVKTHRQALERYADSPVDHATLVLRATTWHPGNLDKKIAKVGAVVTCESPDAAQAKRWIISRCESAHGRAIRPDAADALLQRLGPDLMQLDAELAKLALMVEGEGAIDVSLIEAEVGRGSEEAVYAVQEALVTALATGRPAPVLAKVHELVHLAGHSEVAVGYFLADLLRKINVARMMLASGASQREVGKQVRVWGPRARPFFDLVRQMSAERAARLMHEAVNLDRRTKSGFGDSVRNLECFCATLADGK